MKHIFPVYSPTVGLNKIHAKPFDVSDTVTDVEIGNTGSQNFPIKNNNPMELMMLRKVGGSELTSVDI